MKKYTLTFSVFPRGISKMLRKLERIIALDVRAYSGRATKYIVAYNGKGIPRGILVYSHRCPRKFGRHRMPFLALMDTAIHHRGYGELLFKQFLSEVGYRFFLCCLDYNAEKFWRHVAAKHGLVVTTPFKSPWGTPALLIKNPMKKTLKLKGSGTFRNQSIAKYMLNEIYRDPEVLHFKGGIYGRKIEQGIGRKES
jgi:hypothetical protein